MRHESRADPQVSLITFANILGVRGISRSATCHTMRVRPEAGQGAPCIPDRGQYTLDPGTGGPSIGVIGSFGKRLPTGWSTRQIIRRDHKSGTRRRAPPPRMPKQIWPRVPGHGSCGDCTGGAARMVVRGWARHAAVDWSGIVGPPPAVRAPIRNLRELLWEESLADGNTEERFGAWARGDRRDVRFETDTKIAAEMRGGFVPDYNGLDLHVIEGGGGRRGGPPREGRGDIHGPYRVVGCPLQHDGRQQWLHLAAL